MGEERYHYKDFPHSSHRWLLSRLGQGPLRILEVGTHTGFLGRELAKRGHTVVGIEREQASAEQARRFYQQLLEADLDTLPPIPGPAYQVILLGDVLEHTADPQAVLGHLVASLEPGGRVLVTVPNVAFILIRLSLLFGRFSYQQRGILDRDHLRFFTKQSLRSLLSSANLQVLRLVGLPPPLPLVWAGFLRQPWRLAFLMAAGVARGWPSLWAYQLAAEARKPQ